MARPLRIEYPNAFYHVINRGDNRRLVFSGPEDYSLFLDKLVLFSEAYKIKVRAYCLMPNHFHLYIQTPEGNLSRFMHALLTSFTSIKNHRQKTSGHSMGGYASCRSAIKTRLSKDKRLNLQFKKLKPKLGNIK